MTLVASEARYIKISNAFLHTVGRRSRIHLWANYESYIFVVSLAFNGWPISAAQLVNINIIRCGKTLALLMERSILQSYWCVQKSCFTITLLCSLKILHGLKICFHFPSLDQFSLTLISILLSFWSCLAIKREVPLSNWVLVPNNLLLLFYGNPEVTSASCISSSLDSSDAWAKIALHYTGYETQGLIWVCFLIIITWEKDAFD